MFLGAENVVKSKVTRDESDKLKEKSTNIQHEFIGVGQCHLHPTHSSDMCYRCTARNPAQAAPALVEDVQPRGAQPGSAHLGSVQTGSAQSGRAQTGSGQPVLLEHAQGTFWSNIK